MKTLEKTLAIIAFVILLSQAVRHAYVLWFEPRGSVLDKYEQPTKTQITSASSLDELVSRYDPIHKQAEAERQELLKAGKPVLEYSEIEPFASERLLRNAINDWEQKSREIHEIRFYWLVALFLYVVGALVYKKLNRWFGLAVIIVTFSEFIYWTSPTFFGGTMEVDRLLRTKLVLSLISLLLLITVVLINRIFADRDKSAVATS